MKCEKCPLSYGERTCWECEEYELMCAVTNMPTVDSVEPWYAAGWHRTDKWIKSQNRDELIKKHEEQESKYWEAYAREQGWI